MSIRAAQIVRPISLPAPDFEYPPGHAAAIRAGIEDFLSTYERAADTRYPNLELWGISVLREIEPDGEGLDPVWIADGEPTHPYSRENWGDTGNEIFYQIEDVYLPLPATPHAPTSHSNWRTA